jgi:hypothetical protein
MYEGGKDQRRRGSKEGSCGPATHTSVSVPAVLALGSAPKNSVASTALPSKEVASASRAELVDRHRHRGPFIGAHLWKQWKSMEIMEKGFSGGFRFRGRPFPDRSAAKLQPGIWWVTLRTPLDKEGIVRMYGVLYEG